MKFIKLAFITALFALLVGCTPLSYHQSAVKCFQSVRLTEYKLSKKEVTPTVRDQVEELLKSAADMGAKLAVLPENWAYMGKTDTDKLKFAEEEGKGPIQAFM